MEKHKSVIRWENWQESKEGQDCLKGEAMGQYLKNRLWRAFMKGYEAGKKDEMDH